MENAWRFSFNPKLFKYCKLFKRNRYVDRAHFLIEPSQLKLTSIFNEGVACGTGPDDFVISPPHTHIQKKSGILSNTKLISVTT